VKMRLEMEFSWRKLDFCSREVWIRRGGERKRCWEQRIEQQTVTVTLPPGNWRKSNTNLVKMEIACALTAENLFHRFNTRDEIFGSDSPPFVSILSRDFVCKNS
jgi:hypothetical protein